MAIHEKDGVKPCLHMHAHVNIGKMKNTGFYTCIMAFVCLIFGRELMNFLSSFSNILEKETIWHVFFL